MRTEAATLLAITVAASPAIGSASAALEDRAACPRAASTDVVLMGYWPPTNEMLRPFSTRAEQNPSGWVGENWRDLGLDVHAYFPEFPPDGDPTNDEIGDPGSVGAPEADLQVDYQDTSRDFWRIVDSHRPVILITTSRGGTIGWELEAEEGGHGATREGAPSEVWHPDGYGAEVLPTAESIDPGSVAAITRFHTERISSTLPLAALHEHLTGRTTQSVEIDHETSGNYLSGFLGLHGLYYQSTRTDVFAAGHIHVGRDVPVEDARTLIDATVEWVMKDYLQTCRDG